MEFRYESSETTSLDEEAVFIMYEKKQITREQFLRMMKIDSKEAKNVLGADVVADLEVKTVGDKLDVRVEALPVENAKDEYVAVRRLVRKKIKRSVFGKERDAKDAAAVAPSAGRKIKVRKR